jgi:hypothetical protein
LLAHGWWFSASTSAFSTNKTGCHDIAEILLKVALNTDIDSFQKIGHQLRPKLKKVLFMSSVLIAFNHVVYFVLAQVFFNVVCIQLI